MELLEQNHKDYIMGWQDAPVKNAWEQAPAIEIKPEQKSYTTGEALLSAGKKFIPSTGHLIGNIAQAAIHPIDTANTLADLGAGVIYKGLPASLQQKLDKADIALAGSEKAKETKDQAINLANAVGKDYVNKYGSYEGFKRALAEDPATVLADISTVLYGGGAALKAGNLENAANIANKAATYTNPLNIATSAIGKTAQLTNQGLNKLGVDVTSIPKHLLAFQSGKNPEAFNTIYQAFRQNKPELQQAISEATPLGQKLYGDAIYNYARAYNLPHDVAILAEDQTRFTNPKHLLAFQSGKNPEAFNTIYQTYKQNIPELKQAINESTPLGQKLYKDAIYNYGRAYSLPHDVAILAEDQTRFTNPRQLGVHDLIDKQYELYPNAPNAASARAQMAENVYKPFEELTSAEKIKQATQAGVDTSTFNPMPPKIGENDLYNIAKSLGKKGIVSTLAPYLAPLTSPRLARMATVLAGKGANLMDKIPLSVDQANQLGLMLYQMNQNKEQQ